MTDSNRRKDRRQPAPELRVMIRQHGLSKILGYESCSPVDLCINGFAFRTGHLKLEPLRKLDFILVYEELDVTGSGLIRYRKESGGIYQYGVFVLRVDHDLEKLIRNVDLDTRDAGEMGRRMAQELAQRMLKWQQRELPLEREKILLCDAAAAYLVRLTELNPLQSGQEGEQTADIRQPILPPEQFLSVDRQHGVLRYLLGTPGSRELKRETIRVEFGADSGVSGYYTSAGRHMNSIFEVLQHLNDTYANLHGFER